MRWLNGITDLMDMSLSDLLGVGGGQGAWRTAVHGVVKSWTRLMELKHQAKVLFYSKYLKMQSPADI